MTDGVLVTGASGGLGSVTVPALLGAGFRVAGLARKWQQTSQVDRFFAIAADLSTTEGASQAAQQATAALGRIDALVHLTGGFAGGATIEKTGAGEWSRLLEMNLMAGVHILQAVIPLMRTNQAGRIVVIGARAAADPPAGLTAYCASKAAMHAVVASTAKELTGSGVQINAIMPRVIGETEAAEIAATIVWLCSNAPAGLNGALIPM
jgi:NAD(P)-dependent dehydrogenase (short-subunit alcohol dehydrogenase family)